MPLRTRNLHVLSYILADQCVTTTLYNYARFGNGYQLMFSIKIVGNLPLNFFSKRRYLHLQLKGLLFVDDLVRRIEQFEARLTGYDKFCLCILQEVML